MIETRPYAREHAGDFEVLLQDCMAHYGIPPATDQQMARVIELLDNGRHMSCLLAFDDGQPMGFATWTLTFPAGAGVALYMKELFVSQTARGRGVGRHLLAALARIAEAEGCERMDWQTDGTNALSRAFYTSINAPRYEKHSYRVLRADLAEFRERLT